MRIIFILLIALGTIWVLLMLLWALAAAASGHNIPTSTFIAIATYSGIGVLVIIGCTKALEKVKK